MIEFRIKEKTRSLNESFRGDWRPRAAAAKRQRTKAMQACPNWPGGPLLMVRLTRVSPGTLDRDNLHGALKGIRDGLSARLRIDDASPLVGWEYHQAKGEAEVVVQIWRWNAEGDAPPLPIGRTVANGQFPMKQPRLKGSGGRLTTRRVEEMKRAPSPADEEPRTQRGMGAQLQEQEPRRCQLCSRVIPEWRAGMCSNCDNYYTPPEGSPTNPMTTAAMEPSNAAVPRASAFDHAANSEANAPTPAYSHPREHHGDDAAFNAKLNRRLGIKAAIEAEATLVHIPVCICCSGTLETCTCGGSLSAPESCDKRGVPVRAIDNGRCTPCVNAAFNAEVRRRIGLKAAQEAEETFAPAQCDCVGERHSAECITTGRYE